MVPDPRIDCTHILGKHPFYMYKRVNHTAIKTSISTLTNKRSSTASWRFYNIAAAFGFLFVLVDINSYFLFFKFNPSIISMLTAISPLSLVDSVQRTPQLVVISCGTGMVFYSFVSERYTAALASGCI